jgi:hypothetical protein
MSTDSSSGDDDPWVITEDQKLRFAGLYLLEYMINRPQIFALWLERDDSELEPILEWLLVQGWIEIREEKDYVPNAAGRLVIEKFLERYAKFVYFFDVFSAVDLGAGEFAFARYFEFSAHDEWLAFLHQERFEDLRVAAAEFLDIDAVEIVFMSFLREDRFGRDAAGWQFDLLLGTVWDEIIEICNSALDVEELGYDQDGSRITGEQIMGDILAQGAGLLGELHQRADKILGKPALTKRQGEASETVVEPVQFPKPEEFDFDTYIKPENRDPFWEENWQ